MIINIDTNEKEKQENENIDIINNKINNSNIKEDLSSEILSGEEEDEDDLLKSESESNNSFKSIHGLDLFKKESNNNLNSMPMNLNQKHYLICPIPPLPKEPLFPNKNPLLDSKPLVSNKNENIDEKNDNKSINYIKDLLKDDKGKKEHSSHNSSSSYITHKSVRVKFSSHSDDEEEVEETNELEEEEYDEEEEENQSESINPYNKYINSEIKFKNFLSHLEKGDYIYEKNTNKYYINLGLLYEIKDTYLYISSEIEKKKRKEEILSIINEKYIIKSNNDINDINDIKNKILDVINQPDFLVPLKEGENETKNEILIIDSNNKSNYNHYSNYKKIKVYYLNYLNKKYYLNIVININWKLKDFLNYFVKLYHIPNEKQQNKSTISIFIKNHQFSGREILNNKTNFFIPTLFDYEKDYIIVLEHENTEVINIDLGSQNKKCLFYGEKIPHIVFSSYNNLCVEFIIVSNQLNILECEVYEFKEKYYFNLERNIGRYNLKKAKESLSSGDWRNKCKYLTSIKSINSSSYKNNEDAKSFSISPKLILYHDKSYVFLITSPDLKINVFNSGSGDQGLFIISNDDKAILNGFICKRISDLCLNHTVKN